MRTNRLHNLGCCLVLNLFFSSFAYASVSPSIGNCPFTYKGNVTYGSPSMQLNMIVGESITIQVNGGNSGTTATKGGISLELWDVTTSSGNQISNPSVSASGSSTTDKNIWWVGEMLGSISSNYLHIEPTWYSWAGGGGTGSYKILNVTFTVLKPGTYRVFTKMYLNEGTNWPRDPSGSSPNTDQQGQGTYLVGKLVVSLPAPIASAATSVTQSSFTANWNSVSGATEYHVDVSTSNSFNTFLSGYNNLNVFNAISLQVSPMATGSTYYYRVRAYSGTNQSPNSNTITITTIPGTPTALSSSNATINSFTANWNSTQGATNYFLDVSTNSFFSSFVSGFQNLSCGNVSTKIVSGLSPATPYYYRVRAANNSGTSGNSNTVTATTSHVVNSITLNATPTTINLGGAVTTTGSIAGSGSGSVAVQYEYQKPNTTTWLSYGTPNSYTMTNGTATLSSVSYTPQFDVSGVWKLRCRSTAPNAINSNAVSITVNELPKPDLTVTSISLDKTSVQAGGSLNVTYILKNLGPAATTGTSLTGFYLGTSQYNAQTYLGETPAASITTVNGTISKTYGVIISANTTPGPYYLIVYADYKNTVDESIEDNNINGTQLTVFKFEVTSITLNATPTTINLGGTVTTTGSITGSGSGSVAVQYEYQKPNTTTWLSYGTPYSFTMTNDAASLSSVPYTPQFDVSGVWKLRCRSTSPNAINSNEISITVNELPKPDLTVSSLSLDKTSVQAGGSLNVTYTLKNLGPVAATGTSLTGIYLGTSQYDTQFYLGESPASSITTVNGTQTITQGVVIPANTIPRPYYLVVYADYKNQVDEGTNEGNNINGTSITVIKFEVTGATITVSPTTVSTVGSSITTSGKISGTGNGTVSYKWQWKKPGSAVWEDMTGLTETAMMNNGSATITPVITSPFVAGGQYSLRVATSLPNVITSNEVGVSVGSDVLFPYIRPVKISQNGNQKFTVIAEITDQGSGVNPESVYLKYCKVPTEFFDIDGGKVQMNRISETSNYYMGEATNPSSIINGKFSEGQAVVWKIEASDNQKNKTVFPQDASPVLRDIILDQDPTLPKNEWAQRITVHDKNHLDEDKTFNFVSIPTGLISFKQIGNDIKLYNNSSVWYTYKISPSTLSIEGKPELEGLLKPREGIVPMSLGALSDRSITINNVLSTYKIDISLDRMTADAKFKNVVDLLINVLKGSPIINPDWEAFFSIVKEAVDYSQIINAFATGDTEKGLRKIADEMTKVTVKNAIILFMTNQAYSQGLTAATAGQIGASAGKSFTSWLGFIRSVNNLSAFIIDCFRFPKDQENVTLGRLEQFQLNLASIPGSTESSPSSRLFSGEQASFVAEINIPGAFKKPYLSMYGEANIYTPEGVLCEKTQIPEIDYQKDGRLGFSFGLLGQGITLGGKVVGLNCHIDGKLDVSSNGYVYSSNYKPYFIEIKIYQGKIPSQLDLPFSADTLLSTGMIPFRIFDHIAPLKPSFQFDINSSSADAHSVLIENLEKDIDYYKIYYRRIDQSNFNENPIIVQNTGGETILAVIPYDSQCFESTYKIQAVDISGNIGVESEPKTLKLIVPTKLLLVTPESSWDFGKVAVNGTSDKDFILTNTGSTALSVSSVTISGVNANQFSIISPISMSFTIDAGASQTITVRFNPSLEGLKSASLILTNNSDNASPTKTISLTGTGTLLPTKTLTVTPDNPWDFGNVAVNSSKDKTSSLNNIGSTALSVSSMTISGANANQFSIVNPTSTSFSIAAGGSQSVTIRFKPTSAGLKEATLTITNNSDNAPNKVISLKGTGTTTAILSLGNVGGSAGSAVTLPVTASNLVGVVGFQFSIVYDNQKLTYTNCTNWGGGTSSSVVQINSSNPGTLTFVYNELNYPVSINNGKFFDLNFTIHSGSTGIANVDWSDSPTIREISDASAVIPCNYNNGSVTVASTFKLTGQIIYNNVTLNPLKDVIVSLFNLANSKLNETISDASGNFSFTSLANGTYTIMPTITKPWNGVTAMDITLYKKYIGNLSTLSPLQILSGDVNNSNTLTSIDLTLIKQRIGGIISSFSGGDWTYETPSVEINGADNNKNILALCKGDGNGSYPTTELLKSASDLFVASDECYTFINGSELEIPFRLNKTVKELSSVTLEFNYPEEYLNVKDLSMVANNEDLFYTVKDGIIRVVYSTLNSLNLNENDQLMIIKFGLKNNISESDLKRIQIEFVGKGEFGDYNDHVLEGVKLIYPSKSLVTLVINPVIEDIMVYPNPANDKVIIKNVKETTISIYNVLGQKVYTSLCHENQISIDVKGFVPGQYSIQIQKDDALIHKKLVVVKLR